MVEIPALKDDDPEVRKETQIYKVVVQSKCLEPLIARTLLVLVEVEKGCSLVVTVQGVPSTESSAE